MALWQVLARSLPLLIVAACHSEAGDADAPVVEWPRLDFAAIETRTIDTDTFVRIELREQTEMRLRDWPGSNAREIRFAGFLPGHKILLVTVNPFALAMFDSAGHFLRSHEVDMPRFMPTGLSRGRDGGFLILGCLPITGARPQSFLITVDGEKARVYALGEEVRYTHLASYADSLVLLGSRNMVGGSYQKRNYLFKPVYFAELNRLPVNSFPPQSEPVMYLPWRPQRNTREPGLRETQYWISGMSLYGLVAHRLFVIPRGRPAYSFDWSLDGTHTAGSAEPWVSVAVTGTDRGGMCIENADIRGWICFEDGRSGWIIPVPRGIRLLDVTSRAVLALQSKSTNVSVLLIKLPRT
jgi:hypothetical protein